MTLPIIRVSDEEQLRRWGQFLRDAREMEKEAKASAALAKANLDRILGDSDVGLVDGKPYVRRGRSVTHRLNTTKLRENYPEVAEAMTEESEVITYRLVGE